MLGVACEQICRITTWQRSDCVRLRAIRHICQSVGLVARLTSHGVIVVGSALVVQMNLSCSDRLRILRMIQNDLLVHATVVLHVVIETAVPTLARLGGLLRVVSRLEHVVLVDEARASVHDLSAIARNLIAVSRREVLQLVRLLRHHIVLLAGGRVINWH